MSSMYNKKRVETEFDNGFILPFLNLIIRCINKVNIVEILKWIVKKVIVVLFLGGNAEKAENKRIIRKSLNFTIDGFIVAKFIFIVLIWKYQVNFIWVLAIVIYLLFMNSFTYFYHHIWEEAAILNQFASVKRVRRRFSNLFISILYMILSFGYLYYEPFRAEFKWLSGQPDYFHALLYSISNSFAGSFGDLTPTTYLGEVIKISQTITMFVFITVILARSLPEGKSDKYKGEK